MSRRVAATRLDPQHPLAAARRRLARTPDRLAERVAGVIRRSPPDGVERVMRTPIRRVVLDAIFWQMPRRFNRRQAAGTEATVEWRLTGGPDGVVDTYQLVIADGSCRVQRGSQDSDPRVTITLDGAEFVKLATGGADPMQGYFKGRIKLAGDLMLAAKLQQLFRAPRGTLPTPRRQPA